MSPDPGPDLTIGELARRTAVAAATLRAWEARHGFPPSSRTASGHRRYAPDTVGAVEEVVRRQQAGARLDRAVADTLAAHGASDSAFAVLRDQHPHLPVLRLRKSTLLALTRAVEDECLASARRAVVLGAFQTSANYESSRGRWDALASRSGSAWAFADFDTVLGGEAAPDADPDVDGPDRPAGQGPATAVRVPLPLGSPLRREWVVVCDAPDLPVALTAWEPPGQEGVPDRHRVFECVWTLEPAAVRAAARVCAGVAEAVDAPGAVELVHRLDREPVGAVGALDAGAATRLFSRLLQYVDARA